jgi:hypothetical protein
LPRPCCCSGPISRSHGWRWPRTEAADFTGPAAVTLVELTVREMVLAVLARDASEPKGKALHVQSFLLSRPPPRQALHAAGDRRQPGARRLSPSTSADGHRPDVRSAGDAAAEHDRVR